MIMERLRRVSGRLRRRLFARPRPVVLMYHRIAAPRVDPWNLCVPPARFEQHLQALKRVYDVVPLPEMLDHPPGGRPRAAITFDDGYVDNLDVALPILARHNCPATVFVVTGKTGDSAPFWWDALAALLLARDDLPATLTLPAPVAASLDIPPPEDRPAREAFHQEVWSRLRALPDADRTAVLAAIEAQLGARYTPEDGRAMNEDELRRLDASGVVRLGLHTVSHPSLPALSAATQRAELSGCRSRLEALLGRPVTHLAYPFGDFDPVTIETARSAGVALAVTTEGTSLGADVEPLEIPRVEIRNWDAEQVMQRLRVA